MSEKARLTKAIIDAREEFREFCRGKICKDCKYYSSGKYCEEAFVSERLISDGTRFPARDGEIIEANIFDESETYSNCTVEILRNSATGQVSVGWWKNKDGS